MPCPPTVRRRYFSSCLQPEATICPSLTRLFFFKFSCISKFLLALASPPIFVSPTSLVLGALCFWHPLATLLWVVSMSLPSLKPFDLFSCGIVLQTLAQFGKESPNATP